MDPRLQRMLQGAQGGMGGAGPNAGVSSYVMRYLAKRDIRLTPPKDTPLMDNAETVYISSLALLKMLRHGRAGVPMEVMGLMLGEFVDDYTVRVVDVFAMPQSGTGVQCRSCGSGLSDEDDGHASADWPVSADPIQSVKGKVVIDAFRLINPQTLMLGHEPRQSTSNIGHLNKPSIQALIHGLNRHYYSIAINYRKTGLEENMLMNLHKQVWTEALQMTDFRQEGERNGERLKRLVGLAEGYEKRVKEETELTKEQLKTRYVGKVDPKKRKDLKRLRARSSFTNDIRAAGIAKGNPNTQYYSSRLVNYLRIMANYLASIFGTEQDKTTETDARENMSSLPTAKPSSCRTSIKNPAYDPKNKMNASQLQNHFDAFYEDFWCELCKYGEIEEVVVCDNNNDHLIGNVYARFKYEDSAQAASDALNSRWYAARPIYCELSPVTDFREACCRLNSGEGCVRGGFCNFIHRKQPSPELDRELELSTKKWLRMRGRDERSASRSPTPEPTRKRY
ncbi:hypothetical protein MRB53_040860 [Persea americana]|nr:hypothetical protein MRB53_040860 [Persea americana]